MSDGCAYRFRTISVALGWLCVWGLIKLADAHPTMLVVSQRFQLCLDFIHADSALGFHRTTAGFTPSIWKADACWPS